MEFCPKCGTLLRVNKKDGKSLYACRCGYEKDIDEKSRFEHSEKNESGDEVVIIEDSNIV
ncbi:MAG: DNA-directed RNA polymerase subunit M, partial [Candidatus Methanofastidiosa archaeon]|nr:DNA-directed RNA polymerase subunit M [Candidatus Methanofastidiosa archaeon]